MTNERRHLYSNRVSGTNDRPLSNRTTLANSCANHSRRREPLIVNQILCVPLRKTWDSVSMFVFVFVVEVDSAAAPAHLPCRARGSPVLHATTTIRISMMKSRGTSKSKLFEIVKCCFCLCFFVNCAQDPWWWCFFVEKSSQETFPF